MLSIGVGSAGLLTYVYFSLASHNLSKTSYGEIVVLWSAVFVTISILFRPVEQLLSRTIADRQARGETIGGTMRVAATIQLGLALAFAATALLLRDPIQNDLLSGSATLYWILVAAVLAFGASFFARGFLAGSRRFVLYGSLLLAESTARMSFALAVAVGIANGQTAVALGIVAAPVLSLTVVPLAFAGRAVSQRTAPPPRARDDETRVHAGPWRRIRGRGVPDHGQRAEPPERRAAHRPRLRGRRGCGVHLQRADDRPGAAGPLPGRRHQPAAAPHAAAVERRGRRR